MRLSRFFTALLIGCLIPLTLFAQSPRATGVRSGGPPSFPFSYRNAQSYQESYAKLTGLPREITYAEGLIFILIPPGSYRMGSPPGESGRHEDEILHTVTLTRPFYLGKYETTHAQFKRFVEATKYLTDVEKAGGGNAHDEKAEWKHRAGTSYLKPGFIGAFEMRDDHPVVSISHDDSLAYCRWLQKKAPILLERGIEATYTLPSEAQWEWACRAGSSSRYWWGDDDDNSGKVANVGDMSLKKIHPEWPRKTMLMNDGHAYLAPVGSYRANGFGLHDMIGNVWEFCGTKAGPYGKDPVTDPGDLDRRAESVAVRGGGWSNFPDDCRCAMRNSDPPHFGHSNLGFRVAIQIVDRRDVTPEQVLAGLRDFYQKSARPDGSFQPGIDPDYLGMSDCAHSDLAAVTYAVTIHKTFGWKLPYEAKTIEFLLSRQAKEGHFFNIAGTVDPNGAEGKTYNTTQGIVALHALGVKPKYDPLPVFEEILKEDYKSLPAFSTSFFPLAYLCAGKPIPAKADQGIRALMIQDDTGYMNNHVAATFHASHYYNLIGEETPKAAEMVARMIRDQKPDGSWLLNMPSRDRHGTFDAVFTITHELGKGGREHDAVRRAAQWALSCRNDDGGFGHYPGSTSDADAIYFQVGTLVMAGVLKPADPLPADPHLLSWGHMMPVKEKRDGPEILSLKFDGWIGTLSFSQESKTLIIGDSTGRATVLVNPDSAAPRQRFAKSLRQAFTAHRDLVAAVQARPDGKQIATGSYDTTANLWEPNGTKAFVLRGHRGAVMSVAFSPDGKTLATASIDGTIKLWNTENGQLLNTLTGHKSWVNSITFAREGKELISGSSDGTLKIWGMPEGTLTKTIPVTKAEVRSVAVNHDCSLIAAGVRYGEIKVYDTTTWKERPGYAGSKGDIWAVAFSPDGKYLATPDGDWNRGGIVKLWDTATGKAAHQLQHTGEVLSLAFSPDGKWLAAGGGDKNLKIWDFEKVIAK